MPYNPNQARDKDGRWTNAVTSAVTALQGAHKEATAAAKGDQVSHVDAVQKHLSQAAAHAQKGLDLPSSNYSGQEQAAHAVRTSLSDAQFHIGKLGASEAQHPHFKAMHDQLKEMAGHLEAPAKHLKMAQEAEHQKKIQEGWNNVSGIHQNLRYAAAIAKTPEQKQGYMQEAEKRLGELKQAEGKDEALDAAIKQVRKAHSLYSQGKTPSESLLKAHEQAEADAAAKGLHLMPWQQLAAAHKSLAAAHAGNEQGIEDTKRHLGWIKGMYDAESPLGKSHQAAKDALTQLGGMKPLSKKEAQATTLEQIKALSPAYQQAGKWTPEAHIDAVKTLIADHKEQYKGNTISSPTAQKRIKHYAEAITSAHGELRAALMNPKNHDLHVDRAMNALAEAREHHAKLQAAKLDKPHMQAHIDAVSDALKSITGGIDSHSANKYTAQELGKLKTAATKMKDDLTAQVGQEHPDTQYARHVSAAAFQASIGNHTEARRALDRADQSIKDAGDSSTIKQLKGIHSKIKEQYPLQGAGAGLQPVATLSSKLTPEKLSTAEKLVSGTKQDFPADHPLARKADLLNEAIQHSREGNRDAAVAALNKASTDHEAASEKESKADHTLNMVHKALNAHHQVGEHEKGTLPKSELTSRIADLKKLTQVSHPELSSAADHVLNGYHAANSKHYGYVPQPDGDAEAMTRTFLAHDHLSKTDPETLSKEDAATHQALLSHIHRLQAHAKANHIINVKTMPHIHAAADLMRSGKFGNMQIAKGHLLAAGILASKTSGDDQNAQHGKTALDKHMQYLSQAEVDQTAHDKLIDLVGAAQPLPPGELSAENLGKLAKNTKNAKVTLEQSDPKPGPLHFAADHLLQGSLHAVKATQDPQNQVYHNIMAAAHSSVAGKHLATTTGSGVHGDNHKSLGGHLNAIQAPQEAASHAYHAARMLQLGNPTGDALAALHAAAGQYAHAEATGDKASRAAQITRLSAGVNAGHLTPRDTDSKEITAAKQSLRTVVQNSPIAYKLPDAATAAAANSSPEAQAAKAVPQNPLKAEHAAFRQKLITQAATTGDADTASQGHLLALAHGDLSNAHDESRSVDQRKFHLQRAENHLNNYLDSTRTEANGPVNVHESHQEAYKAAREGIEQARKGLTQPAAPKTPEAGESVEGSKGALKPGQFGVLDKRLGGMANNMNADHPLMHPATKYVGRVQKALSAAFVGKHDEAREHLKQAETFKAQVPEANKASGVPLSQNYMGNVEAIANRLHEHLNAVKPQTTPTKPDAAKPAPQAAKPAPQAGGLEAKHTAWLQDKVKGMLSEHEKAAQGGKPDMDKLFKLHTVVRVRQHKIKDMNGNQADMDHAAGAAKITAELHKAHKAGDLKAAQEAADKLKAYLN